MGEQNFAGRDIATDGATLDGLAAASGPPTGVMFPFAGLIAAVPAGYLPCDGSAVSRATFSDLFAVISTAWGVGDGSTTFNLPDFRARSFGGLNDGTLPNGIAGGRTTRALAATAGVETHTHTGTNHTHTGPNHTHTGTNHTHTYSGTTSTYSEGGGGFPASGPQSPHSHTFSGTTSSSGAGSTGAGGTGATGAGGTGATGSGGTIPPTAFCPFIIKT